MDHFVGTLALIAGGIGLLVLLRRLSRPVDAATVEAPAIPPLPSPADAEPDDEPRLRICNYYFRSFDTDTGPPDAECFYDELFLEIENPDSGDSWTISYFVGTPSGIAQVMREEGWDEMLGSDLLIVRRFDRDLILRSLLERVAEQYEIAPEAGDVGDVVLPVPRVQRNILADRPRATLGMVEGASQIFRAQRLEQRDPALMQGFEQRE